MRPYAMTADRGLQPDTTSSLYVHRDTMHPRAWVLSWSVPGSFISCGSEGECSRIYHRTRSAAVAYGLRHYDERASRPYWER